MEKSNNIYLIHQSVANPEISVDRVQSYQYKKLTAMYNIGHQGLRNIFAQIIVCISMQFVMFSALLD